MSTSGPMTLGGGELGSRCTNEEFEFGGTNTVIEKGRSPLKIHSNWIKHAYGKERELRHPIWIVGGLSVEVNEEGIRRVAWSSTKDGLRYSTCINRSQKGQVVGPSKSRVYQKRSVTRNSYKSGSKSIKWVIRGEKPIMGLGSFLKPVLDLDPNGDICMGCPNTPALTNPSRFEVGESSSLADSRLTTHKAQVSVMVESSKTQLGFSGSTVSLSEVGPMKPSTPVFQSGLATSVFTLRSDGSSANQELVASPVGRRRLRRRALGQSTSAGLRRWKCRGALSLF